MGVLRGDLRGRRLGLAWFAACLLGALVSLLCSTGTIVAAYELGPAAPEAVPAVTFALFSAGLALSPVPQWLVLRRLGVPRAWRWLLLMVAVALLGGIAGAALAEGLRALPLPFPGPVTTGDHLARPVVWLREATAVASLALALGAAEWRLLRDRLRPRSAGPWVGARVLATTVGAVLAAAGQAFWGEGVFSLAVDESVPAWEVAWLAFSGNAVGGLAAPALSGAVMAPALAWLARPPEATRDDPPPTSRREQAPVDGVTGPAADE